MEEEGRRYEGRDEGRMIERERGNRKYVQSTFLLITGSKTTPICIIPLARHINAHTSHTNPYSRVPNPWHIHPSFPVRTYLVRISSEFTTASQSHLSLLQNQTCVNTRLTPPISITRACDVINKHVSATPSG